MEGKKIGIIIAVVLVIALIVFFVLGFRRKGPEQRTVQSSNGISSIVEKL